MLSVTFLIKMDPPSMLSTTPPPRIRNTCHNIVTLYIKNGTLFLGVGGGVLNNVRKLTRTNQQELLPDAWKSSDAFPL